MGLINETQVPLEDSAYDDTTLAGGAAMPPSEASTWVRTNLAMEHQIQDQWCWAAVSTSIAHYFGSKSWTQCSVVSQELGEDRCCTDGSSLACNRAWYLDRALQRVDTFDRMESGMPLGQVFREIDGGRPAGVRVGWAGGRGHFVAIEGYRDNQESVAVEDPWYGASVVPVDHMRGRYQGTGKWTHTYYTRKP